MLLFRCKPLLPASRECLSTSSIAQRFKTCKQTEYRLRALSFLPALKRQGFQKGTAVSIPTQEVSLPPSPEISAFSSQVHRLRDIWRIVTMNRKVAFGLGIITFFVLVAIFGPIILTSDPNAFSIDILSPPSA